MKSWTSYPKIYSVGHAAVKDILTDDVIIEEKLDGSQISFGVFGGELRVKSKSVELNIAAPDKMFLAGVEVIKSLAPLLQDGWTYRGEYFAKPKHNALAYDAIPVNHIAGFDIAIGQEDYLDHDQKLSEFARIGLSTVPLLYSGRGVTEQLLRDLLNTKSFLGGALIEGVVIKSHKRFGVDGKPLLAKFVSESFKEIHSKAWKKTEGEPGGKDYISRLFEEYTTEARWHKAVQHLRDAGQLKSSPEDVGPLMAEVTKDILAECGDEIKDKIFKHIWKGMSRAVVKGLPQWYKDRLLRSQFGELV